MVEGLITKILTLLRSKTMKKILCVLFVAFTIYVLLIGAAFAYVYYKTSFFDVERTITYYSNGKCTVTQVDNKSWGDFWIDLYYGRLQYDDINQDRCLIHCEIRGGISNGNLDGYIFFNNDSVLIYPSEGAFFKVNCNEDKLFLKERDYEIESYPNVIRFVAPDVEEAKNNGIEIVVLPPQKVKRIFNVTDMSNVCDFYSSSNGERPEDAWGF
ncbi:MAG: hypothetical protein K5874_04460 [Bacteroidaceae bacterium]|nr:hypothetical protein [Bacteroidaceae bacterium]